MEWISSQRVTAAKKAGAGTSCRPEEIGVMILFRVEQLACGSDHLDTTNGHARGAQFRSIPTDASTEQIAAECDAGAVAHGKRQITLFGHAGRWGVTWATDRLKPTHGHDRPLLGQRNVDVD
jgi:hypothetical protein